jgi:ubiquinone/menaquinone biosynthesis C-methylase UbiE
VTTFDVYGMTDKLSPTIVDVIVARLEARGKNSFFQKMMHDYLDTMDIDSAATVLDLGCGTGVASRAIARRPGFKGAITGIDLSPYLVEVAERLAIEEGVKDRVTFRSGDTRSLDIKNQCFDAVVAHTLVSHVDDPLAVLKEAARVARPGSLIGIFDGDYASMTFSHEDPAEGRKYEDAIQAAVITNPRVMRDMPRLLREAKLELVKTFSYVLAEVGRADFWIPAIESFRKLVPQSGMLSTEEINRWADARLKDSENGTFFGASNYYGYVARRN